MKELIEKLKSEYGLDKGDCTRLEIFGNAIRQEGDELEHILRMAIEMFCSTNQ